MVCIIFLYTYVLTTPGQSSRMQIVLWYGQDFGGVSWFMVHALFDLRVSSSPSEGWSLPLYDSDPIVHTV